MDYLEASRRIADHLQVHKFKEQPRCEKITEALTLAVKVLERYSNTGGVVARYMGVPIECHRPSTNETILLRFDPMQHDLTSIERAYDGVRQEFPDNKIVILPKGIDFEHIARDALINVREHIDSILEGTTV